MLRRRWRPPALFDRVEGGFFRYATRRDWTVPHYEKMLPDNAELLALYASAYERTRGRVLRRRPSATSSGSSSRSCTIPPPARSSEARTRTRRITPCRRRSGRRRFPPSVDRTIFSEYNGGCVSALVAAHRAFGAPGRRRRERLPAGPGGAAGAVSPRRIPSARRRGWRGTLRARRRGEGSPSGLLADHAAVATAYLDLHDATGNGEYLRLAEETLSVRRGAPVPGGSGGVRRPAARGGRFRRTVAPICTRSLPTRRSRRPCCGCARASAREDLFGIAVRTLCGLSAEFDRRGAFGAPYGSALLLYRKGNPGKACLPGDPACG